MKPLPPGVRNSVVRVAILEDHLCVREWLGDVLQRSGMAVTASTGVITEFLQEVARDRPDLALIDLTIDSADGRHRESGLSVLETLASQAPQIRTIIFSATIDAAQVERCLKAGAWGYLYKLNADGHALTQAVRLIAAGVRLDPGEPFQAPAWVPSGPDAREQLLLSRLTGRELEVLQGITAGYDNLQLSARLSIGERTVKAHVSAIYRKLQVETRVMAVLMARSLGVRPMN